MTVRRSLLGIVLAAVVLVLAAGYSSGAAEPAPPSVVLAFKDVLLFDGETVVRAATVVVRDGRIVEAGTSVAIPAAAEVVDGRGKTLLPGLIDAHVHLWNEDILKSVLAFGVTAVVDMFTSVSFLRPIQEAQARGQNAGRAFLVSPGTLCTVAGGHGTQFGIPIPTIAPDTDLQAFVDARIAEGADFIKIIQDDGSSYRMPRPTLSDAQVAGLIRAAHRRGKKAVVHAATLANCQNALAAGADGLAHLYFDGGFDAAFGEKAATAKAFVIPTLSVLAALAGINAAEALADDPDLGPFLAPSDIQNLSRTFGSPTGAACYAADEKALGQLRQAGVPILAGTDAPNPGTWYGVSLHRELELLVRGGLTPLEALRAATSAPADAFGIPERGRVKPGYRGDLLLVAGDPTSDITATRHIAGVWHEGLPVDREPVRRAAGEARAAVEAARKSPVPDAVRAGLISDFDTGKIEAAFGAGWMATTDTMVGGKSKAELAWTKEGAEESRGAMKISGEIVGGSTYRWAGALFSPGPGVMAPVNLSSKKALSFWARGDARLFAVEIFAQSLGVVPAIRTFTAGSQWKEYVFSFADFGLDGGGIMAVIITAYQDPGPFTLFVDNVRLR